MLKRNFYILIFALSLLNINVFAQEFSSSVDKTKVGENETFQAYFTFKGESTNELRNFKPPSFEGFRILSGPNQSTSMQYINGAMSGSVTYSYYLQGAQIGKYTIRPASIDYRGKSYTTSPIEIEVVKGSASSQQQGSGRNQQQSTGGISNEELAKNVFIRAIPDKQNVLLGEQVTVTYKLYTKLDMNSPQISKLPTYQGFWAEELDMGNNIYFDVEMYEGERVRAAVIKKVALFPTKTGELSVTPFELDVPVQIRRRRTGDIFDQFFNDSFFGRAETVQFKAKSNTLKINVRPLPEQNKPSSFKGAVGKYNFKTEFDKSDITANESIALKINVEGTGNIKLIEVPKPVLPAGFEQYEPKVSDKINRKGVIGGTKIIEYLLVPRIPGVNKIPAMEFSYFDLNQRRYVTLATPEHIINVREGTGSYEAAGTGLSKEDIRLLSEDIRYIKLSDFNLEKKREFSAVGLWFWIMLVFPAALLGVLLYVKQKQDALQGNVQLLRYRKAEKQARERLKKAKKELLANNLSVFHSELSMALFGYLEDKLGIKKSDFTLDRALKELSSRNVKDELIEKVKEISERCEFVRFAPASQTTENSNELYENSVKLIIELEDSVTVKKR